MYCPKCGSLDKDEVLYCRGCGADLASVRTALEPSNRGSAVDSNAHLSTRQLRRLRRRGLDGTESPLTLATRAIDLQSSGVRGLLLGGGFAFITYMIYLSPPIGGIFWLLPLGPAFLFFSAALSRFIQAAMIKKLLSQSPQPDSLPDAQPDLIKPTRSIYQTDDLAPHSITDATTRHLS